MIDQVTASKGKMFSMGHHTMVTDRSTADSRGVIVVFLVDGFANCGLS